MGGDLVDDPTVLTVERMNQDVLGAMLGVRLRRRLLEFAERDTEHRCPCGSPAPLFSFDLLTTRGLAIFLCDGCAAAILARATA